MDFVEILSGEYIHQEMNLLKLSLQITYGSEIMTTWNMDFLAWIPNFWHFETAFIQPFLIGKTWNLDWQFIFT